MLNLDTNVRAELAQKIIQALEHRSPGTIAELKGSLATGAADQYSDIDILWEIPDDLFRECVDRLEKILSDVRPVASLRSDPVVHRSAKHRLVYVQFEELPLFWRVDIEIFAESVQRYQHTILTIQPHKVEIGPSRTVH